MYSPNAIGWLMFLTWPFIALIYKKKLSQGKYVAFLFVFPYLFFPVKTGIDPPVLPPFDKTSIAAMVAMLMLMFDRTKKIEYIPKDVMSRRLIILLFLFPIFTVFTNTGGYSVGGRILPGLGISDIINITFFNVTEIYVPFILAYSLCRSEQSIKDLLILFLGFVLFYSLFIVWEIRMSPQLHAQIYGFFPHSFAQMMREGGFRSVAFLGHGLLTSILLGMAIAGAFGIRRYGLKKLWKFKPLTIGIYLLAVLVLNKSLASLLFTLCFVSLILFFPGRLQVRIMVLIGIIIMIFPAIRSEYVPLDEIVAKFEEYSPERAQSLEFRVQNEDKLIEKAFLRSLFGWGTYGRNMLYDPIDGNRDATTDSYWIILFGQFGLVGYFVIFGLIVFPVYRLNKSYRLFSRDGGNDYSLMVIVAAILMVNFVDQLLNDSVNQLTFLFAGALVGGLVAIKNNSYYEKSESEAK